MKNFINALDILIVSLNKTIAVLGLASGTLLAFANVVARYFFDKAGHGRASYQTTSSFGRLFLPQRMALTRAST